MHRWWYFPSVAAFTLLLMSVCRLVFFYVNNHEWVSNPPFAAMLIGLRFDVSVVAYWLAPAFLLSWIYQLLHQKPGKLLSGISSTYLIMGFFIIVLICVADISYYKFYYTHIGAAALNWTDNPGEMAGMLWGESLFRWSILCVLLAVLVFFMLHIFMLKKNRTILQGPSRRLVLHLALLSCFFLAMRGGLRAKPLNIKDSWYSQHYFFNQMALSPVYNFYQQTLAGNNLLKPLTNQEEAEFLEVRSRDKVKESYVFGIPKTNDPNVVFILMEGMASHKLKNAPFLDSICRKGIFFDSFYSTGEHTYNGVFSSLWGEPAIMGRHMLRWMEHADVKGLPYLFRKKGYAGIFQIPHARSFDNMGSFLWKHHFDTITDVSVMRSTFKTACVWGTSDHLYLEHVVENMNYLTEKKKPVFSVALTVSDHSPYFFPKEWNYRKDHSRSENATLYADWSLRHFFEKASQTAWFKNTIFVLVADHGQHQNKTDYPLPLSLHHIPFLIYSPGLHFNPITLHRLGIQTDILPTLSGLLNLEKTEAPLGFDLFHETRPWVVLSSEAYYGILDSRGYTLVDEYSNFFDFPSNGAGTFEPEVEAQRRKNLLLSIRYMHQREENLRK